MRLFFLINFCLLMMLGGAAQTPGYEIRVKISGYTNEQLYLCYPIGDKTYIKDSVRRSADGFFVFEGSQALPPGMYLIVMQPENNYANLLLGDDQHFSCETSISDFTKQMRIKGSTDNFLLYQYANYITQKKAERAPLDAIIQGKQGDTLMAKAKLKALEKTVKSHQEELVEKNKGTVFGVYVKSQLSVEDDIPSFSGSEKEIKRKQYEWARTHWFDHYSLANPFFIRTQFFWPHIEYYLNSLTVIDPDSQILAVDYLLKESRRSDTMTKYLISTLLNFYAKSPYVGMDAVYVHIALKYYKAAAYAHLWTPEQIQRIVTAAEEVRPFLVGVKIPNLRTKTLDGMQFDLHEFKAKYTVLFFWNPTLKSSLKWLPDLKNASTKYREAGVKVVAICIGNQPGIQDTLQAAIRTHNLEGLINTLDLNAATTQQKFPIKNMPVIFVLDEEKRIRSKNIFSASLPDVFETLLNK